MKDAVILVVEDEPIVGMEIMEHLKHNGYQIPEIIQNGDEVIEAVNRVNPDLILMDIKINGTMDGVEAASKIRDGFEIPVLFMTAYSDSSTIDRAASALPEGYLVKPIDERELLANVEVALKKGRFRKKEAADLTKFVPIVDSLQDSVCIFDETGRLFHLNMAACLSFGVPDASGFSGYWLNDIIDKGQAEEAVVPGTYPIRGLIADTNPFSLRLENINDRHGNKRGIIGFLVADGKSDFGPMRSGTSAVADALVGLLPPDGAILPRLHSAGFLVPCPTGSGGLYDIFSVSDDIVCFYSVDVMGTGTLPSLIAYSLHEVIRMYFNNESQGRGLSEPLSPQKILGSLNEKFFAKGDGSTFFSLSLGLINLPKAEYVLVRAGHTKTLMQSASGDNVFIEGAGSALGAFDNVSFEESSGKLKAGDRMVLCSDGLLEVLGNGDINAAYTMLGNYAVQHRHNPLGIFCDAVRQACYANLHRLKDDASLLAIELPQQSAVI